MAWAAFAYLVVPAGTALTLMLISGFQSLVNVANFVLNSPIRIQKVQLSLALVFTGFCAIMALLSYSSLRRAEHMLEQGRQKFAVQLNLEDQLMRNVFMQGRNFWMSLLGLAMWGVAWRLKTLFDSRTLTVNRLKRKSNSLSSRIMYAAIAVGCAAMADVPLCRLNYSLQLMTFITPRKDRLMDSSRRYGCDNAWLASAQGECAELCAETRKLSDDRLWAINWARDWHFFGKLAAKGFDEMRNVEQGASRIEKLFAERSCERVLSSTDKSNTMVNMACGVFAGVSILGCLIAIQNLLSDSDDSASEASTATAAYSTTPAIGVALKTD